MFGNSYAGLNPDEIEVRVWAFVVKAVTILVLGIAFGVLYAIAFEEQAETLAPIDAVFLEILKAVAFMGVGTLGGISGRKAVASYAEKKAEDEEPK
jgi:Na+/serine symporter